MDDNSIDLTITSPPYDSLRVYNGYAFDFESTSKELYRVTKEGGVLVWIVGDETIKGSETGTSFRQALGLKEAGFKRGKGNGQLFSYEIRYIKVHCGAIAWQILHRVANPEDFEY